MWKRPHTKLRPELCRAGFTSLGSARLGPPRPTGLAGSGWPGGGRLAGQKGLVSHMVAHVTRSMSADSSKAA